MKNLSLSLLLSVLASAGTFAQTLTIEGVTYSVNPSDKTCFIQDVDPAIVSLEIPQSVSYNSVDYQVVSISFGAFTDCSALEAVSIPATITSIGNNAFNGCSALTTLTFADSAEPVAVGYSHDYVSGLDRGLFSECPLQTLYLGRDVTNNTNRYATFSGNDELTSLTIGNQVMEISGSMFSGCSALESVSLPESVISIGSMAFSGCSELKTVSLPSKLESLGESAFNRCSALTSIALPSSLTEIAASTFADCSALHSVSIPESITAIGSGAFSGCTSLTGIAIPESVNSIGSNAFSNCSALQSIALPSAINSIESATFSGCSSLTSVTLPEGVAAIGPLAFSGCTRLAEITIPASVTSISNGAFTDCSAMTKLTVESGADNLDFGYNTPARTAMFADCPLAEVYLGRNISYPAEAEPFKGLSTLKNLTIGAGATILDASIFNDCSSLDALTFEPGDTEIACGANGFENCPISSIVIGRNFVLTDGQSPFSGMASFNRLTITATTTDICANLFSNCPALESITIEDGSDPLVISAEGAFSGSPVKSIFLGRNLSAGVAPFSGLDELSTLTIGAGVSSIAPRVFRGCPALSKVIIEPGYDPLTIEEPVDEDRENTVRTLILARNILGCGFQNFYNLSSVTIHDGISTIGPNLFESCTALKSVSLPNSVVSIGNYAFANCSALESVLLPASLCAIGEGAFYNCAALTAISLPESLTSISDGTFARCSALTAFEIPASIVSVGELAFADCRNLSQLTIADATEPVSIHSKAFSESQLKNIYAGRTVNFEGKSPFAEINSLASVTVGNFVETLTAGLFKECPYLAKVKLGSSLKSIEEYAFLGCGSLRSVRCEALTPPSAIQTAFPDDAYRFGTLYVAEEAMTLYQTIAPWDLFRQVSSEPESGIDAIHAAENGQIFNLQGIKLSSKPAHGLFIQNGKKIAL